MVMIGDNQKTLKKFVARRHPLYEATLAHWKFLEETYEGGRTWFGANIHRYHKEGDKEFSARMVRAYRFNHTREVVDLVDKYLFKMEIARNEEEAPEEIKQFWKNATLHNQDINEFMKSVSTKASIFGRIWIVVDSNKTEATRTIAEEKANGVRTYAYTVTPQHVLDMSYDDLGQLNWILIHEVRRDDEDPFTSNGDLTECYRLWTQTDSTLFCVNQKGGKAVVVMEASKPHDLGRVPVIQADAVINNELYTSAAMIADVAYLDRAVANYLSNLDAIIQDQTFSQLAMPAQNLSSGEAAYDKMLELGTKRVFIYDGEGGSAPFYLSPDVKQAEIILKVISKIINEIYHSIGLAGERTKEDNSQGIDNSSGVAKAYDFERVNSLLAAKADSLELVEERLNELVAAYAGKTLDKFPKNLSHYPNNFDVRGLYDEFEIAARLALIEAPESMRREQMDRTIRKLFPQLTEDLLKAMKSELKTWPPKPLLVAGAAGGPGAKVDVVKQAGNNLLANKLVKNA